MKYIRRLIALLCAAVMFAALVVGIGVIFAVKNVNVTLLAYSASDSAEAEIKQFKNNILDRVRGTLIIAVGQSQIEEALGEGKYLLEKVEKVYPCTIDVTVRERRETYVAADGKGSFSVYDENGVYLRSATNYEETFNNADGAPNLLIEGADNRDDVVNVAGVCSLFKETFSSLRSVAEKVIIKKAVSQFETDSITFVLRCGTSLEIQDYTVKTAEKISEGYKLFADSGFSGEQKLSGIIYCFVRLDGEVVAVYNGNA